MKGRRTFETFSSTRSAYRFLYLLPSLFEDTEDETVEYSLLSDAPRRTRVEGPQSPCVSEHET